MSSASRRRWVPLLLVLSVGTVSCGTYEFLDPAPSSIDAQLDSGRRVKVWFKGGGWREDIVVRVEDDVIVCRRQEFRRDDIEGIELWRGDAGKTLGLVGGVVGFTAFCLLAAHQSW